MTSAISCPLWSSVYECHKGSVRLHLRCGLSVVCVRCAVCSVVCLLFCSAWMCCLEEVYRCLLM